MGLSYNNNKYAISNREIFGVSWKCSGINHILSLSAALGLPGAKEVQDEDDFFILMAPQNAVGNCIIDVCHFNWDQQYATSFT